MVPFFSWRHPSWGPRSSFMLQSKATAQLLLWTFPFTFSVYYHFCGSLTALQEKVRERQFLNPCMLKNVYLLFSH